VSAQAAQELTYSQPLVPIPGYAHQESQLFNILLWQVVVVVVLVQLVPIMAVVVVVVVY
jgi:hypothetical protein